MKKNVLIIGAGGVAQVVAHKCAQHNDILGDLAIASRSVDKCEQIIASVQEKNSLKVPGKLTSHALNALDVEATKALIRETDSQIVINVGSAFINMSVLQACIETGAAYLDTAIHEEPNKICETPPWYNNYEWQRRELCKQQGVTAILGVGFDPGVVNAYAALAANEYFDSSTPLISSMLMRVAMGVISPPTSTRKSTSVNLPVRSGPGRIASGPVTQCSRSNVLMICQS